MTHPADPQSPPAATPDSHDDTITRLVVAIGYTQAHVAATCKEGHDLTPPQRLLDAITDARTLMETLRKAAGVVATDNEELRAECSRLRAVSGTAPEPTPREPDTERLDWLEANTKPHSYGGMFIAVTEGLWEVGETVDAGFNGFAEGEGPSLRAAIDDARRDPERSTEEP